MNNKLLLWSITVGLGGFLFGLDTAVISGAIGDIKSVWQLDDLGKGFAAAIAVYGTVFGAGLGGIPADRYGRKNTLLWIGILFFVSAIGAAIAQDINTFLIFRFIGGLSIGASSVVAPIYISEIAPPEYRGRMGMSFQFNIVFGIFIAYVSNYLFDGFGGDNDWRWMLGVVAIPSLIFSFLVMLTPESPRWLIIKKNDEAEARKILAITESNVDRAVEEIKTTTNNGNTEGSVDSFFSKKYAKPILLAFLFAFFNQLSGINAIIYFAPDIFKMTGLGESSALLSTTGIGLVNLLVTMLGWYLIDRIGRRTLMFIGSIGYIVSLALVAMAFYNNAHNFTMYYIFVFIAAHAVGQGAVIWVFISEIFPTSVRAAGMAWGCWTHWIFAALITHFFPTIAKQFGAAPIFSFFCFMMVFQLLYVWLMMPETKGVSLEDLQKRLIK